MMPRFDLLDEVTKVYLPKTGDRRPVLPRQKPGRTGGIALAAALVVVLAAVVGL